MTTLLNDIKYTLRQLCNNPRFTIVAVLSLALGIGGTIAMFSVANAVLLRPLPCYQPQELVCVGKTIHFPQTNQDLTTFQLTPEDYQTISSDCSSLAQIVAMSRQNMVISAPEETLQINGLQAAEGFFSLLQVKPYLGRLLDHVDHLPDAPPTAILGYDLWQRTFGADPEILDKAVQVNRTLYTVVGVMPPEFGLPGTQGRMNVELWLPLSKDAIAKSQNIELLARLAPETALGDTSQKLKVLSERIKKQQPDFKGYSAHLLVDVLFDSLIWKWVTLFSSAVILFLLIACVNVTGLLLIKLDTRSKEIAVRQALGTGHFAIARLFIVEGVVLSVIGSGVGWIFSFIILNAMKDKMINFLPRALETHTDPSVIGFTFLITLITGLTIGALTSWKACRPVSIRNFNHQRSGSNRMQQRLRQLLAGLQVALALMILLPAGLLTRNFARLATVDLGFNAKDVLLVRVGDVTASQQASILERIVHLPGVLSVGAGSSGPFPTNLSVSAAKIAGQSAVPTFVTTECITEDYFRTIGVPIVAGRLWTAAEQEGVLISQECAKKLFGDQSPLAQRLELNNQSHTVLGVVKDYKGMGPHSDAPPTVYYLAASENLASVHQICIRTTHGSMKHLIPAIRSLIKEQASMTAILTIEPLTHTLLDMMVAEHLSSLLTATFAGLGLSLALIGIYGVVSFTVQKRTREFGIRMALGAKPLQVILLSLYRIIPYLALGMIAGWTIGLGLSSLLEKLYIKINPLDPLTHLLLLPFFVVCILLACYIPAHRATKIDPMKALRYE